MPPIGHRWRHTRECVSKSITHPEAWSCADPQIPEVKFSPDFVEERLLNISGKLDTDLDCHEPELLGHPESRWVHPPAYQDWNDWLVRVCLLQHQSLAQELVQLTRTWIHPRTDVLDLHQERYRLTRESMTRWYEKPCAVYRSR